jgi:hypothetical protein
VTRGRRDEHERGAALVEFTIIFGLLVFIVMGIFEFGSAWSNKIKVETAARAGARVGSNLGATRMADFNLLQSVKSVVTELGLENIRYVVVYKANAANGAIPTGCGGTSPTSQTNQCNVYTGTQLASLTAGDFTGTTTCGAGAPDRYWCPLTRQSVQHLGNDSIGIWIKADSATLTNFFGSPLNLESTAVMRLEPKG